MKQTESPQLYVFTFACEVCGKSVERFRPVRIGLCYGCRQAAPWRAALDAKLETLEQHARERLADVGLALIPIPEENSDDETSED